MAWGEFFCSVYVQVKLYAFTGLPALSKVSILVRLPFFQPKAVRG